jgi:signal transduction histidine kinase
MKRRLRVIIIGFSLSFAIVAALSFYSLKQFSAFSDYSNQIDRTNKIITELYTLESDIKEIDVKERGYMLTKDSTFLTDILEHLPEAYPAIEHLKMLTTGNVEQHRNLTLLKTAFLLRVANFKSNLEHLSTLSADSTNLSQYFYTGIKLKRECLTYIKKMTDTENASLQQRFKEKEYYKQITDSTLKYLITIFGIITIILFIFMMTELVKRKKADDELQLKLIDLKRSHAELEQIAFAASHDLQEPLRKVRILTDRLQWIKKGENDMESIDITQRINQSVMRMQDLIDDVVNLVELIKEESPKEETDLNTIINSSITELDDKIVAKNAIIHRGVLPDLVGYPRQLQLLFSELIDNALKFSRPGTQPIISIQSDKINGVELVHINKDLAEKNFYRISISDNGIGFDNKFISKMFQIFQRLHNNDSGYDGKGMGLAICQRVMVNHEGYITAHGHISVGATFKLFFPVTEI